MKRIIKAASADKYQDLLYFLANKFSVNSPDYRGARQPEYNRYQVNASEYADELRPYYYECKVEGQGLQVLYITQEECNQTQARELVREIERWVDCLYDAYCKDIGEELLYPNVDITVECRYGQEYGYYIASLG